MTPWFRWGSLLGILVLVACGTPETGGTGGGAGAGAGGGAAGTGGGATGGGTGGGATGGGTGGGATGGGTGGGATDAGTGGGATDSGVDAGVTPQWVLAPTGISASELAVLVNSQDPQSMAVANYYVSKRAIPPENVILLSFPVGTTMTLSDYQTARAVVNARMDGGIQAFALSWTQPYQVGCMSAGTAFAIGYDAGFCAPCMVKALVATYDSASHRPSDDYGVRPTMMLAATDAGDAFALIDRGIASDDTFPTGDVYLYRTTDPLRSVRSGDFQQTATTWSDGGLKVRYVDSSANAATEKLVDAGNVLGYLTGLIDVPGITTNTYLPGAVADHLTSIGGQIPSSQMSVVRWLQAGVTASYGTVVEPCNFVEKFPRASVLWSHYFRGEPIIEAYWKSVNAPGEGNFVGEPLARPWGRQVAAFDAQTLTLTLRTTALVPGFKYAIDSAPSATGPWTEVKNNLSTLKYTRVTLSVQPATAAYYRVIKRP